MKLQTHNEGKKKKKKINDKIHAKHEFTNKIKITSIHDEKFK